VPTFATRHRTGASVLAEMLDGYGVSHFFMVPAILRRTMAELERNYPEIQRVVAHGEKSAAYMADGYARASGRPGVCAAQVIGALNLAAGLREPFLANSPVIALTGGRLPSTKFRQVYQEVDDVPAFEVVTKFNATIDDVTRLADMLRHAFRVATTGAPGPVHLQIQGNEGQLDADEAELDAYVDASFARAPAFRPPARDSEISRVLERLARAERPVLVAGGGVRASRAGAKLVELAHRLDIPVATSLNAKDTIDGCDPLSVGVVGTYSRETANRVVNRADLVCFVGTQTGGMTTHGWTVPPIGTPAIQIDIEPRNIGRNYPLEGALLGDARDVLTRMCELAPATAPESRAGWLAEVAELRRQWTARYATVLVSDGVPIRPERICAELTEIVPDNGIVVVDTGHAGMWMGQFFDSRGGAQSYLRSCGHLGWAYCAGLGAKCAQPERPVVVFTGDAGLYYHLAEIETAVRRKINTVTVVNNNSGGNQSKRGFDRAYGGVGSEQSRELWTYQDVNFAQVAESMGAVGIRVDKPSEIRTSLEHALHLDRPVVVDVRTDIEVLAPPAVR
jgi:acetolactate synthase I/II/III large subunit